ncbi:hypothetical protein [Nocardioides massiliensis]|nr:hypothetical protein [Nocardioides massiliensis]
MVGIVVDPDDAGALAEIAAIRTALRGKGTLPLIIASRGGMLADGLPVQRTFDTARSVEFDALIVLSAPSRAATAPFDARDLADPSSPLDPRVRLLVEECFRHSKPIVGWGAGADLLRSFRLEQVPGVVAATSADQVTEEVLAMLAKHRVWEREEGSTA